MAPHFDYSANMGSSNNNTNNMHYNFLQDADVWQGAPILTGSTKFEPHPDVKNIMITGGAGFM
jgi:dTDP-glucose 4,6-dehydratase